MAVADLGACEWFVMELRRSGLIERGQLEQIVGDFLKRNPRSDPQALSEFLVKQKTLTAFQAERIVAGKAQGLVLGPYTLIDTIGTGSMGTVYKAMSKTDNQLYAVKVLPRRSMWNVRLARRQVRSFAAFSHPSVVPFVDVGTAGGLHYLAWPLIGGETLEAMVQRQKKLAPGLAALFGLQVAQGLAIAHQNGLFHGFLKPSNIMIAPNGEAKVLDFGIGSLLAENEGESLVDTMSTANTMTSGLDCTSPESIMEPTNRTPAGDQYSLGCTLYYCLTGQYPFPDGSAVEKMMAHQTRQPKPIRDISPNVPEELAHAVDRLLEKQPASRFTSVDEVVEALEPLAAEMRQAVTSSSYTETPRPITATPPGRRPMGVAAFRQAVGQVPPAAPTAKPVPAAIHAHLPVNVRVHGKSPQGDAPSGAASAPSYTIPSKIDKPDEDVGFSPLTLVLGGMAVMCVAYFALNYFQIIK
jgi:serine/threonine protein kinase